ncbi:glycosyltransferase family 1 protein [Aminobacter sp. AP02]|uniref:glycosyltransferase family 1 protein n=1 Tax=Aminobacter sp. AP02 TaxID=2135737 RepID=UPI000D7B107F|nr:glycosyltransferase family 1 protein [Aminobacter sp. AP02]PWK76875.1 glycosyltransferase involved in cell wall biosynthesis [Aminobacter sp. AP02]
MSAEDLARTFYRRMNEFGELRKRRQWTIQRIDEPSPAPAIYFVTPDHDSPSGGIRVIYRHVDILNAAGFNAYVVHWTRGFRCNWFENDTRVTNFANIAVRSGDLLVFPEVDVDLLSRLPRGVRHVIFNQNSHLTWSRCTTADARRLYAAKPDLAGVVTVSEHNRAMLARAFPDCHPLHRVHLGLDEGLFYPAPGPRARRVAYMPRRGRNDALQVLAMLHARGALHGWEVVPLDGLSHAMVADQLRTTCLFLAFTHQEGFGLPSAEAMACGNYVIGNHGFSGREFFRPEFSTAIEAGDTLAFVRAVEEVLSRDNLDPGWCVARGRLAAKYIQSNYSVAAERNDVVDLYTQFLIGSVSQGQAVE